MSFSEEQWQVDVVRYTQQAVNTANLDARTWMPQLTQLGDPTCVFLLAFSGSQLLCNERLCFSVVLAFLFSDVTNALVKWIASGNRPFWMDTTLEQFHITCETGYGMPSGHVMVTAAVYAMVAAACGWVFWLLWGALVLAISVSRVYVAAHLPLQTIYGAIAGAATASFIQCNIDRWTASWKSLTVSGQLMLTAIISLAIVVGIMGELQVLEWLEWDPNASIRLASSACRHSVAATTHPIQGIMRDIGIFVGAVVGWQAAGAACCYSTQAPMGSIPSKLRHICGSVFGRLSGVGASALFYFGMSTQISTLHHRRTVTTAELAFLTFWHFMGATSLLAFVTHGQWLQVPLKNK